MTRFEGRSRSLLATAFALVLVASPVRIVWAHASRGWVTPFVVWAALALLAGWAAVPDEKTDE